MFALARKPDIMLMPLREVRGRPVLKVSKLKGKNSYRNGRGIGDVHMELPFHYVYVFLCACMAATCLMDVHVFSFYRQRSSASSSSCFMLHEPLW